MDPSCVVVAFWTPSGHLFPVARNDTKPVQGALGFGHSPGVGGLGSPNHSVLVASRLCMSEGPKFWSPFASIASPSLMCVDEYIVTTVG